VQGEPHGRALGRNATDRRSDPFDVPFGMELFDTTQVALERAMAGAAQRHAAIAANLANVNTPGYRRRDVDFHGALQQAMRSGAGPEAARFTTTEDAAAQMRADGGSVDADAEGAALARNGLEQEALATIVKVRASIIQTAIGQ
jgi:flagellar basal-body rod protein FlgB